LALFTALFELVLGGLACQETRINMSMQRTRVAASRLLRWPAVALVVSLLALPALQSDAAVHNVLFSTYLGGDIADQAWSIAVDTQGNTYIAGYTASTNFPTLNAYQPTSAGQGDAFVSKFGPDGALIYSTYLGGNYLDYALAIAVDEQGSAYVTGWTGSSDFPVVNAYQSSYQGGWDAFVAKLAPDGHHRLFPYLGGSRRRMPSPSSSTWRQLRGRPDPVGQSPAGTSLSGAARGARDALSPPAGNTWSIHVSRRNLRRRTGLGIAINRPEAHITG
jgi:hypothetical protein